MDVYTPKLSELLSRTHVIKKIHIFNICTELNVLGRLPALSDIDVTPLIIKIIIGGSSDVITDLINMLYDDYCVDVTPLSLGLNGVTELVNIVNVNITNKLLQLCTRDNLFLFTASGRYATGATLLHVELYLTANILVGVEYVEK